MKKKLTKKLSLNKEYISSLNFDDMYKIKGGFSILCTDFIACSVTCSIIVRCCFEEKKMADGGLGDGA